MPIVSGTLNISSGQTSDSEFVSGSAVLNVLSGGTTHQCDDAERGGIIDYLCRRRDEFLHDFIRRHCERHGHHGLRAAPRRTGSGIVRRRPRVHGRLQWRRGRDSLRRHGEQPPLRAEHGQGGDFQLGGQYSDQCEDRSAPAASSRSDQAPSLSGLVVGSGGTLQVDSGASVTGTVVEVGGALQVVGKQAARRSARSSGCW